MLLSITAEQLIALRPLVWILTIDTAGVSGMETGSGWRRKWENGDVCLWSWLQQGCTQAKLMSSVGISAKQFIALHSHTTAEEVVRLVNARATYFSSNHLEKSNYSGTDLRYIVSSTAVSNIKNKLSVSIFKPTSRAETISWLIVFINSKLIGQTKQDIWWRHQGLWETRIGTFHSCKQQVRSNVERSCVILFKWHNM